MSLLYADGVVKDIFVCMEGHFLFFILLISDSAFFVPASAADSYLAGETRLVGLNKRSEVPATAVFSVSAGSGHQVCCSHRLHHGCCWRFGPSFTDPRRSVMGQVFFMRPHQAVESELADHGGVLCVMRLLVANG